MREVLGGMWGPPNITQEKYLGVGDLTGAGLINRWFQEAEEG